MRGTRASAAVRYPTWVDWLLTLAVAAASIGATELAVRAGWTDRPVEPLGYALLVAIVAPLLVRDRYPLPVLFAVVAGVLAYTWLGYPAGFYTIPLVFALWAAVASGQRIAGAVAALIVVASLVLAGFVLGRGHAADPDSPFWLTGWLVVGFVLGEVSRGRREYVEAIEQRAIDAERTREEEARRRAGEERIRIARELHDVLAHNISMINVQAGVAVHLLDRQPEQARTALVAINEASREALRELRATLGVLRQVDEDEPRAPAPRLAELDELLERARSTGLEVAVETRGEPAPLPPGTDLAAYRIVQESLTNVARHAGARRVSIVVEYRASDVRLTVDDDGTRATEGAPPAPGNGITGMRERATAAGGTLDAAPRPEGGFRVRATLPVGDRP